MSVEYNTSIVGMPTWQVSTTATALASSTPNMANGAAPVELSIDAFATNGQPLSQYADPKNPFTFSGCTNTDAPQDSTQMVWTDYGYPSNVNDNVVQSIITGSQVVNTTINFGADISQHNNGCRANLFDLLNSYSAGLNIPLPIVDHNGIFQGWATFHLVSAQHSGNSKTITGYFMSRFVNSQLTVGGSCGTSCPKYLGSYDLKLTN